MKSCFRGAKTLDAAQQQVALRWLDLLSGTRKGQWKNDQPREASESFVPLRIHLFHQTLAGLWACADPQCPEKQGTELDNPAWPFGMVYLEARKHCDCGAPAYEVVRCGEVYLLAEGTLQDGG